MAWGNENVYKVFYWPNVDKYPGAIGTRVALISASSETEASYKFKEEYKGEYHTIDRIVKC